MQTEIGEPERGDVATAHDMNRGSLLHSGAPSPNALGKTVIHEEAVQRPDATRRRRTPRVTTGIDVYAIGKRHFIRRFKKATNNTPIEYIQRVKIEAAKKQLENSRKNVNEVMYDVGYSDVKAFRTVFRKITGLSPIEYRNKYNKEAVEV